jgi:DNA-directed RNA polymerase specialized sigma24 family protein
LIQRIKEALEDLDPELRAIIVFRVEDELTRMEIEDRLQLSPKAIIWREERAYETLRRVLSRHAV